MASKKMGHSKCFSCSLFFLVHCNIGLYKKSQLKWCRKLNKKYSHVIEYQLESQGNKSFGWENWSDFSYSNCILAPILARPFLWSIRAVQKNNGPRGTWVEWVLQVESTYIQKFHSSIPFWSAVCKLEGLKSVQEFLS